MTHDSSHSYQAACLMLAVRLKTLKAATQLLLQIMNISTIPIGVVLITAGVLLASAAAVPTLSSLSLGLVVSGSVIFLLCLLGAFAAGMESRSGLMVG